jgi:hypothetical protein
MQNKPLSKITNIKVWGNGIMKDKTVLYELNREALTMFSITLGTILTQLDNEIAKDNIVKIVNDVIDAIPEFEDKGADFIGKWIEDYIMKFIT